MTMPGRERRTTLIRVAAVAWLLLISAAVVIDHVALARLAEQLETVATIPRVEVLERQLAEQIAHDRQQPDAITQARYEADRIALEQRLVAIEQSLGDRHAAESLLPRLARIEQLEARLAAARPATPVPTRPRQPVAAARPTPTGPPFAIVGVELRADERFLAILPSDASAVSQVRLLRTGEAEAGWRFDAIDGTVALFRRGSETLRLAIPVR
ncbi:hypothetical protein [Pseudomonas sp. B392_1p]|uniref:hypothetical protein n=1 Tax=Pseudomonas sp. B392_1p TaxID=3457507 RepID=UPI003FCFD657